MNHRMIALSASMMAANAILWYQQTEGVNKSRRSQPGYAKSLLAQARRARKRSNRR